MDSKATAAEIMREWINAHPSSWMAFSPSNRRELIEAIVTALDEVKQQTLKECEETYAVLQNHSIIDAADKLADAAAKWSDYKSDNTILAYEQDLEYKEQLHKMITVYYRERR